MKKINHTLSNMARSGIRRIMDKTIELDPGCNEIIHLEVGEPQEATSLTICNALSKAAADGYTKYTQNAGFIELRKAIKRKLELKNNIYVNEGNIFVTPGATFGVSITIGTIINPKDEVLVPDPGYPNFAAAVRHYGGIVKYYTLKEENNFQLDFENIKSLVNEKTKLIIINSPSNPTGTVLSIFDLKKLVDFTSKNDIWILSDEVYESYVYSKEYISPLSLPNSGNVVGVYSFSKSYNMTGLRVGYVVSSNEEICNGLIKALELYISCAPSISQRAAIVAINSCEQEVKKLKIKFKAKIEIALEMLNGFVRYIPDGAFYILINISKTGLSSDEFADILLDTEKVAVAPGSTFGPSADKYIRIALTAETNLIIIGIKKIIKLLKKKELS